jgi:Ulp1 protease family, C-terminal catalytic domain
VPKNITKYKVNCSPLYSGNSTCYTEPDLYVLKSLWNKKHPQHSIQTDDPKLIWNELQQNLKDQCDKETCWLSQDFIDQKTKAKLMKNNFAPLAPKSWKRNPKEWLSSDEIKDVMKQYEEKYKCFAFIGPSPIDFEKRFKHGECVWEELCNFKLNEELEKGKTKFGISINTDPHHSDGEHWVSLFIHIPRKEIFYYDSAGFNIPAKIKRFVDKVTKQASQIGIDLKFGQTYPVSHQYKNTECGTYSLFFMIHMLEDKITTDYLKTHVIKDEYIQTFRKIYFNYE